MSELKATVISKCAVIVFGGLAIAVAFVITLVRGTLTQIAASILSSISGPLCGLFIFGSLCPWAESKGALWGTTLSTSLTFLLCIGQRLTKGAVKNQKLPPGPIDQCPAALLYNVIGNVSTVSDWMSNSTFHNSSTMTSAYVTSMETTAVEQQAEPSGFSRLFMLSYQWFGAVGIIAVIVIGSVISLCLGGNKDGDVDPKYMVPVIRRFLKSARHELTESEEEKVKVLNDEKYTTLIKEDKFNIQMDIIPNRAVTNSMSRDTCVLVNRSNDVRISELLTDESDYTKEM